MGAAPYRSAPRSGLAALPAIVASVSLADAFGVAAGLGAALGFVLGLYVAREALRRRDLDEASETIARLVGTLTGACALLALILYPIFHALSLL